MNKDLSPIVSRRIILQLIDTFSYLDDVTCLACDNEKHFNEENNCKDNCRIENNEGKDQTNIFNILIKLDTK